MLCIEWASTHTHWYIAIYIYITISRKVFCVGAHAFIHSCVCVFGCVCLTWFSLGSSHVPLVCTSYLTCVWSTLFRFRFIFFPFVFFLFAVLIVVVAVHFCVLLFVFVFIRNFQEFNDTTHTHIHTHTEKEEEEQDTHSATTWYDEIRVTAGLVFQECSRNTKKVIEEEGKR